MTYVCRDEQGCWPPVACPQERIKDLLLIPAKEDLLKDERPVFLEMKDQGCNPRSLSVYGSVCNCAC